MITFVCLIHCIIFVSLQQLYKMVNRIRKFQVLNDQIFDQLIINVQPRDTDIIPMARVIHYQPPTLEQ